MMALSCSLRYFANTFLLSSGSLWIFLIPSMKARMNLTRIARRSFTALRLTACILPTTGKLSDSRSMTVLNPDFSRINALAGLRMVAATRPLFNARTRSF